MWYEPVRRDQSRVTIFAALADETRCRIVDLLVAEGPLRVKQLVQHLDRVQPNVSRHLAVLTAAGLLHKRVVGRRTWYALDGNALTPVRAWLSVCEKRCKKRPQSRD